MQKHFKVIITISLFFLIVNLFKFPFHVFSQMRSLMSLVMTHG